MANAVTFQRTLPEIQRPSQPANGVNKVIQPIIKELPPKQPSSPLSSRTVTPELPDAEDENRVDQMVQPILKDRSSPVSSKTLPAEISAADAEAVLMLFTPTNGAAQETKKTTPMDIDWVKKEMELARTQRQTDESLVEVHYLRVMEHINNSVLDSRGLLVNIFCSLIIARQMQAQNKSYHVFNERAAASLTILSQRLWSQNCAFKNNYRFMYLVGTAHLMIHPNSADTALHRRTKNYFLIAAQLMKKSSLPPEHPLQQKNLLGQSLACLYQARRAILKDGINKRRADLIETLNESRKFLENPLKTDSSDRLKYQMALTHCLTTVILETQQAQEKPAEADRLYKISEDHLKQAEELLNAIPVKTGSIRALLGIIKYKNAFDHAPVRCSSGWEGMEDLSAAGSLLKKKGGDPLLRFAITDTLRQIAWAVPVDYMRYRFERSLEQITEKTGGFKLLAESSRLVFNIQTSLWQLIEYNKILSEFERQVESTDNLDTLDIEFVDITLLINEAKVRRDTLNTLRKQSHSDRLKNPGKDLRLLKDFADAALLHLAQFEWIFRNNYIQKDAYEKLNNHTREDLNVIEILKHVSLKLLKDSAFQNLRHNSAQLIVLLEKSKEAPRFAPIWYSLRKGQLKLEKNYLPLTIIPENPKERRLYADLVQKIGNKLDKCYTVTFFNLMLFEKLKDYDYKLDPELQMV